MAARIGILGAGAVGARVARQLLAAGDGIEVVLADSDVGRLDRLLGELGPGASALRRGRLLDQGIDVLAVAAPCGHHVTAVRRAIRAGVPAISTSDRIGDVERLLRLDDAATRAGVGVLVGVGLAPGLSCLLATHLARELDTVDEVHVTKAGTGGPACARQHHRALKRPARDWRDGAWVRRPGGSGRELVWFPEPVGGADCYRGALPDALLLRPAFDGVQRITARMAATRQDRFTSWLPMLSPPHEEGGVGAVRVEVRGRAAGAHEVRIAGASAHPAVGAAIVAATAVHALLRGEVADPGVRGLAGLPRSLEFLRETRRRGLRAQRFEGLATH